MIKKSKNKYYEITIEFFQNREIKKLKFISDYSISSKKFNAFIEDYFSRLEGFEMFTEDWGSQFTVSNAYYEEYKDKLHEGMTPDRYLLAEHISKQDQQRWDNDTKIERAFNWLVERLVAEGCRVMVYKAKSTSSCYIKIDDGAAGSIRISDHKGKSHLSYKYNLILGTARRKEQGYLNASRYFAPFQDIELLLRIILKERNATLNKYGASAYRSFMEKNKEQNKGNKFWRNAKYVSMGECKDVGKGKAAWRIGKEQQ